MSVTTPSTPHYRTTSSSPSPPTTNPNFEDSMGVSYPTEMAYGRVVRFDSECVLIPELSKIKKPLMVTKSYAIPLWKKRTTSGESSAEEVQDSPSSSPTVGGVVFKLPLPSFMAKPTRSPSRTRECSRPPCLTSSDPSHPYFHYSRQRRLSNPTYPSNALPNPIQVVDTHHLTQPSSSSTLLLSSPTGSEATPSGSGGGTRSPRNRSPAIPYHLPAGLATTPTTENLAKEKHNGKDKDREREKDKDRVVTVPLRACCPDCFHITEECARNGDQWKERFSKGARRRRGSSVSSVSSSEGGDDLGMYSPLASYKPLRELGKENEKQEERDKVEDKPNSNPNSQVGLTPATSTSAIADDDDEEVVSSLSLKVRVDEVDCIQGSSIGRLKRKPSLDPIDTEDDDESSGLQPRGRETSASSIGSASSTFSAISGVSSTSSNTGTEEPAISVSLALESSSLCDNPSMPIKRTHTQPLPSPSTNPPSSYTMATHGDKRRRKPSTTIKEDEEPPEERYEGFCRNRERGRTRREHHRLGTLKTRNLDADDDVNMLFPLPSPRRSPSTSPLNTPQDSATPTNGGSATPSPNPSPTPSSSAVHLLNTNAPKKRSKLGVDDGDRSPVHPGAGEVETKEERGPHDGEARTEPSVLPRSLKRKEKELPPSIAKAAEIALAETEGEGDDDSQIGNGGDLVVAEEDEWVKVRANGHTKAASEPAIGSLKEKKVASTKMPSFLPPSTTTTQQPQTASSPSPRVKSHGKTHGSVQVSPPTASRPQKQQRRSSLRAGAFLEIFRSVPGITP